MADPVRNIWIDKRMSQSEGYIPDDWAPKAFGLVKPGSTLDNLLVGLLLGWRTTAYTAAMPAIAIKVAQSTTLGYAKYVSPDGMIVTHSEAIVAKVSRKVPELVDDRSLREALLKELVTVADEFRAARSAVTPDMPIEPIWANFLEQDAFAMSVWSSQRVSYVAFYNAYEAFIVECLKVGTGLPNLRSTDKKVFNEALRTGLGKDISSPCWSHHEINVARLVRNALSHNGGRETEELKKQKHGVKLIGDELQIVPEDNHRMLRRLRQAVEEITAVIKGNTKFVAPATKLPQLQEDEE
jgi:hypothetical protein